MLRPKTLQQRLLLFMLLPVGILLTTMGLVIFVYARSALLDQWKEAAVSKLARAAHDVDMRLSGPTGWMGMFHKTAGGPDAKAVREWVVRRLEDLEIVEGVTLMRVSRQWERAEAGEMKPPLEAGGPRYSWSRNGGNPRTTMWMEGMDFDGAEIANVTPPRYDDASEHETVSLTSDLLDRNGRVLWTLEVRIGFNHLIKSTLSYGWSPKERAYLVNAAGVVLACNLSEKRQQPCYDESVKAALRTMENESYGTLIHTSHTTEEVVGFHRLMEAPWTLVVVAQSSEILSPIYHFQLFFFALTGVFFLLILLLIKLVAGQTVSSIQDVSRAAKRVAQGEFDALPPVKSQDEVGQLINSFNEMVLQLNERIRLKEALDLAMQVQQSLLPSHAPRIRGLDIAGESIYCDETGGDYYDFITFSDWKSDRIGIAVGDVAGHGISAALFMTTVRAFLRSRFSRSGSLSDVMDDINRLLCMDTARSGDFMSLFLALAEVDANKIRWVRAGHPPAILYDLSTDSFEELRGDGVALGFDETYSFREHEYTGWNGSKILFLGTDGIWETENARGEMYGMERLRDVIRLHCQDSSKEIIRAITEALLTFRQTRPQEDDVTMVVVKAAPD